MVKTCLLCKKVYTCNPNQTFHIFPSEENLRKAWFVNIAKQHKNKKFIYLCSGHFSPNDFVVKYSGHRYLKKNAVPMMKASICIQQEEKIFDRQNLASTFTEGLVTNSPSQSFNIRIESPSQQSVVSIKTSSSTITVTDPEKEVEPGSSKKKQNLSSTCTEGLVTNSPPESFNIRIESPSQQSVASIKTSSSTITVTDPENEVEPGPSKKKRFVHSRYIGDCNDLDMQYSKRAIRNWKATKKMIYQQRKRIKQLQCNKRRLQSRLSCMETLLTYLRSKNLISENSEAIIKEFLPGSTEKS